MLLEAYDIEWELIDLRCKRLQKMRQLCLLTQQMEQEKQKFQCQIRKMKRQEREKEVRKQNKRQQKEARCCERETKETLEQERKDAVCRQQQQVKKRADVKRQKKQKLVDDIQLEMDVGAQRNKDRVMKHKVLKTTIKSKQAKHAKIKRIVPMSLPSLQPEDDECVTNESQGKHDGHDSSPSELPDDDLLNLLSFDKGSDSDDDDEPSMASLILPAAQASPKKRLPVEKKSLLPQKIFAKKRGGVAPNFDFTNAEAKRLAKAAEVARDGQYDSDKDDAEPEPMPDPSMSTSKKRLKRRKKVANDYQGVKSVNASEKKMVMTGMTNATSLDQPKNDGVSDESTMGSKALRKRTVENGVASKAPAAKMKSKTPQASAEAEGRTAGLSIKKTKNGKTETMSIKQRLANVELLAQMNKMQDMNTPKVLGKKTKRVQTQEVAKTLAAKRAEMRKVLLGGTEEADACRPDQMIEEGDLDISLNSSGLMSDTDSPENFRDPTLKRPRVAEQGDVTPTKKLQFIEITKRLAKSPMPRFLRTPTPLTSRVIPSAFVNRMAASPAPRAASAHNTTPNGYETRRMNSAPVGPKKTMTSNRFGIPTGGTSGGAGGGSFSMFDAFVNSGATGAIPRLKMKARGNV